MKQAFYYRYNQSVPPKHWYQKSIGWFGKTVAMVLVLSLVGAGGYGYAITSKNAQRLASESSNPDRLRKVTAAIEPGTAENIVDVQYVLDRWAKDHSGQTWSVSVKSIEGPHFSAHLNQDKKYESTDLRALFMALPLYQQVAPEYQKSIQVQDRGVGRTMEACVDKMIRLSDDGCAQAIDLYIDFNKASEALGAVGLTNTTLSRGKPVQTTAADATRYMTALHGDSLPRLAKETLLKLFKQQLVRGGVPEGCPGCIVSNSARFTPRLTFDSAVVDYSGGSYAITIISSSGSAPETAALSGAIQQKILDTTTN